MRTQEELPSRRQRPEAVPRSPELPASSRALGARAPASGASVPTAGSGGQAPAAGRPGRAWPAAGPLRFCLVAPGRTRGGVRGSRPGLPREDGGGRLRAPPGLAHTGGPGRAPGLGARGPRAVRRDPGPAPEPGRLHVRAGRPGHPSAGGHGHGPAAREDFREVRPELPLPPASGLRGR